MYTALACGCNRTNCSLTFADWRENSRTSIVCQQQTLDHSEITSTWSHKQTSIRCPYHRSFDRSAFFHASYYHVILICIGTMQKVLKTKFYSFLATRWGVAIFVIGLFLSVNSLLQLLTAILSDEVRIPTDYLYSSESMVTSSHL